MNARSASATKFVESSNNPSWAGLAKSGAGDVSIALATSRGVVPGCPLRKQTLRKCPRLPHVQVWLKALHCVLRLT